MFSIELPQPAPNKSYFVYAASVFGFRNLVPPTAEQPATPDTTGGIWEVVKDYFVTGNERTVEGWVHQMVDDSSTRECRWNWGNSPIYLEKGYPLVPAGSVVTSRYEIVTLGKLACLKLTNFIVYTTTGTERSGDKTLSADYDGTQATALELIDAEANRQLSCSCSLCAAS
jgi:hypothetical protein